MQVDKSEYDRITGAIIDVSMMIHRRLGPGLLKSVYARILAHELRKRGFHVECEKSIPFVWDGMEIDTGFRADMIVNTLVHVELKAVEQNAPVHKRQVLTHLRLADLRLGLLINFGVEHLRDGIFRIANNMPS